MKFYFCETCGKRVTEVDLAGGSAKDKKLRGVFCRECAAGVMTMEQLPLSTDQAREILKSQPPPAPTASPGTAAHRPVRPRNQRGTGSIPVLSHSDPKIVVGEGKKVSGRGAPDRRRLYWGLASVGVVLLLCLLPYLFGSSATTTSATGHNSARPPTSGPRAGIDLAGAQAPGGGALPSSPQPVLRPASPEAVVVLPSGVSPLGALPLAAPVPAPGVAKLEPPPAPLQPGAVQVLQGSTGPSAGPAAETEAVAGSKAGGAGGIPAAAPPQKTLASESAPEVPILKPHEVALEAHFDRLLPPLQAGSYEGAGAVAREIAQDSLLGPWKGALGLLPEAVAVLSQRMKSRWEALRRLKGSQVQFETAKGSQKGILLEVGEASLTIQARFQINGQWKAGKISEVPLADLTAQTWQAIAPERAPATAGEWTAGVLKALAAGALEEAGKGLAGLSTQAVREPLAYELELLRRRERERLARAEWAQLEQEGKGTPSEEQARDLLKRLGEMETRYKPSAWLRESAAARVALREKLESIAQAFERRVKLLFKGQTEVLDVRQMSIRLKNDLSIQEQLADWGAVKDPWVRWSRELQCVAIGTGGRGEINSRILESPPLLCEGLGFEMDYQMTGWGNHGNICLLLGSSAKSGNEGQQIQILLNPFHKDFGDRSGRVRVIQQVAGETSGSATLLEKKLPVPNTGRMQLSLQGGQLRLTSEEMVLVDLPLPPDGLAPGVSLGTGVHLSFAIKRLTISGRLDPHWFKAAAEKVPGP